ncbi:hypothetical protein [uncultured Ruminococcus sp.]|uniref:hypothetical protein n=1 Tax=uncultured Ruminococcus sp. TaxID=165186 RepID=UPI0025CC1E61|nr:hypothetical protein [uncultured Ruminococcus sp.]
MSTMKRPEMEVVRFKEADIIVASGNIATLSGFNDNVYHNAQIQYGNNTYDRTNYTDFPHPKGNFTIFQYEAGEADVLDHMFGSEDTGTDYDGTYKWDKNIGRFIKQ